MRTWKVEDMDDHKDVEGCEDTEGHEDVEGHDPDAAPRHYPLHICKQPDRLLYS